MKKISQIATAFLVTLFLPIVGNAQDLTLTKGKQLYQLCAGCHGFQGEGNQTTFSPALAGQLAWYLERQINNFRGGLRGYSKSDVHGRRMMQMAQAIKNEEHVKDLVAFILTLPTPTVANTVQGDVEKGRALYEPCAVCHGANAEGFVSLNAPALDSLDPWYQVDQLIKFKDGSRGTQPQDIYGQQMVPVAQTLTDEQEMRDLAAYIYSVSQ